MGAAQGDSAERGGSERKPAQQVGAVESARKNLDGKEPKKWISGLARAGREGGAHLPAARRLGDWLRLSKEPAHRVGQADPKGRAGVERVERQQRATATAVGHAPVHVLPGTTQQAV